VLPAEPPELSEDDLTGIAIAEHTGYYRRRLRAGLSGESVVSWDELPPDRRQWVLDELRTQLAQLEDVAFERVGLVGLYQAWQVTEPVVIRTKEGRATARPGDWVVESPGGERWPVRNKQFRWSYRPAGRARPDRAGQATATAAASSSTPPASSS
jgi:hypothetical protein